MISIETNHVWSDSECEMLRHVIILRLGVSNVTVTYGKFTRLLFVLFEDISDEAENTDEVIRIEKVFSSYMGDMYKNLELDLTRLS